MNIHPQDAQIAELAKALGHPVRIQILRLLQAAPGSIGGDIVGAIGLAQSTVSEHLRILKAAGVIRGEISGPRVCCALPPNALTPLSTFAEHLVPSDSTTCCTPEPNRTRKPPHEPV